MSFFKFGFGSHSHSFTPKPMFGHNHTAPLNDHGGGFGHGGFGGGPFGGHSPFALPQIKLPVLDKFFGKNNWNDRDDDDRDDHHDHDKDQHDHDKDDDCEDDKGSSGTGFPDIPNDTLGVTFSIDLNGDGVNDDYLFVEANPAADPTQTTLGDYYNAVSEDLAESHPGYDPQKVVVKATIYSESEGESYYHFTGNEVVDDEDDTDDDCDDKDDDDGHGHGGHHVWSGWKDEHDRDDDKDEDDKDCDDKDDEHKDGKFYKLLMKLGKLDDRDDDCDDDKDDDNDDEDDKDDHKFLFC